MPPLSHELIENCKVRTGTGQTPNRQRARTCSASQIANHHQITRDALLGIMLIVHLLRAKAEYAQKVYGDAIAL